ncbi:hypothetical protein [Kutzneria sp. NPDC051319]|uniref:maltokinase N-terminal cap-like domain-containing protein n=1 Tax=Kutzneria sp. NPDC051319 TaxID=3155047 RepID=UPI00342D4221
MEPHPAGPDVSARFPAVHAGAELDGRVIHQGATLTPSFREFLPPWLARQPWHRGDGVPELRPVGFFRFEDPAGEVGIEIHVIEAGGVVYQVPMTYRGAPLDGGALIVTAEHSVLGPRWIYQAETDPVWRRELLRLVRENGTAAASRGSAFEARGVLLSEFTDEEADIELAPDPDRPGPAR